MNFEVNNGELTIKVEGRVDSNNANGVDGIINDILDKNPHNSVVLDFKNLSYISSAGLRVVLKVKKREPEFKIINASSEVYDIFDMTGFAEIIDIEKAYRQVNVEGCEVIGKGANGEVYRVDAETIVKVYKSKDCLPDIKRERELAKKAFVLGIPSAISYEVVQVGDTYGSVFEMFNADPLNKIIYKDPANKDKYIDMSIELFKKLHNTSIKPGELPSKKEEYDGYLDVIKTDLEPEYYNKLKKMFDSIEDSHFMIHGDYHAKNIMFQKGEIFLIDMDTIAYGNKIFDLASAFAAYIGFTTVYNQYDHHFLSMTWDDAQYIYNRYIDVYFKDRSKEERIDIYNKVAVVTYTHLYKRCILKKDNPEEKEPYRIAKEELLKYLSLVDNLNI